MITCTRCLRTLPADAPGGRCSCKPRANMELVLEEATRRAIKDRHARPFHEHLFEVAKARRAS